MLLVRCFLVLVCFCIVAIISLKIYLGTPHASALLSKSLTSYLQQPVRISGLHTAGASIYLTGVSLGNPPDVPPGNLMKVDSIVIAPDWGALLTGRRSLRRVAFEGLNLDLLKNRAGVWNFSSLQRLFSENKSAGTEFFVETFIVTNGAVQVNGEGAKGISFHVFNLATKGSSNAQIKLSFEDPARNSYTVTGTTRPGIRPAFDLTLAAPALSLNRLAGMLKLKNNPLPEGSMGSLHVTAVLQDGRVRAAGRLNFSRIAAPVLPGTLPVTGSVAFAASYTIRTDELNLESFTVTADSLMRGHASGTITRLRSERRFAVAFGIDELNLAALKSLLPEDERRKIAIGGTLRSTGFRITGSGSQGLISATGLLMLQDGSFERGGQLFFKVLNSTATVSRVPDGFLAKGTLSQKNTGGTALLKSLTAPYEMALSSRLKLTKASIPTLTANVMGLAVIGRLGYNPAAPAPFDVSLRIPAALFSSLHDLPEKLNLKIATGNGSLAVKAAGRGPQEFSAAVTAQVSTVRGVWSSTPFGIQSGVVETRIIRGNGKLSTSGKARFSGLSLDERVGDASFSYRISDGTAFLDNAAFSYGGVSANIARIKALIPVKETIAGTVRYPLVLEVAGGEIRQDQADVNGFSGTVHGSYLSDARGRWLEGTADVSSARVAWQGKTVASPAAHVTFSRTGGRGTLSGLLLEGALTGEIAFNPLALREGGKFQLGIRSGRLSTLGALLPRRETATLSNGTFDGTVNGNYSGAAGLACRFNVQGADIAVSGSGGKSLLNGGGVNLTGGLSGSRLVVDKAVLSAGKGVALQVTGEVSNPLSPQREGDLVFSLPRTSLNSIIDPFVNILPRVIQEATIDGTLAVDGRLALHNGREQLEGALVLNDVLLEVPSQKFKTAAINGHIPISLDLSGDTPVKARETSSFTRNNYPALLKQLRAVPDISQTVSIGSVEFGSLNLGEVLLQVSAGNGVTKIDSLRSSLYDGALLGTGFVTVKKGISYRADLLINGLSLKRFCATIPSIKDYISGRVDGVISLIGEGKNMAGLVGFTDLWAREGSGEKMLVSKEFLQKLSGKKLSGIFFSSDRPYDQAEVVAVLEKGDLTFKKLDILHTNLFGVRDLSVSIAPDQNRIALDHLFTTIKQAADRGKAATGGGVDAAPPPGGSTPPVEQGFQWQD
jgi:uncharacterized protein involved in outer membrane biogenesis